MVTKFNPKKKEAKRRINSTISGANITMVEEVEEGFQESFSSALDGVLDYFREEVWDKNKVPKNLEEEKTWKWEGEDDEKNK